MSCETSRSWGGGRNRTYKSLSIVILGLRTAAISPRFAQQITTTCLSEYKEDRLSKSSYAACRELITTTGVPARLKYMMSESESGQKHCREI